MGAAAQLHVGLSYIFCSYASATYASLERPTLSKGTTSSVWPRHSVTPLEVAAAHLPASTCWTATLYPPKSHIRHVVKHPVDIPNASVSQPLRRKFIMKRPQTKELSPAAATPTALPHYHRRRLRPVDSTTTEHSHPHRYLRVKPAAKQSRSCASSKTLQQLICCILLLDSSHRG